jgi:hypothetical protein
MFLSVIVHPSNLRFYLLNTRQAQRPSKEVLQAKLHKAIEEATLRLGIGDE